MSETPISPLRARMIEDMSVRKFGEATQRDYIRHVKTFSTFLGRSPATALPEDLPRIFTCGEFMGMPKCSTVGGSPSSSSTAHMKMSAEGAPEANILRAVMR
jgi:hypothetical protein